MTRLNPSNVFDPDWQEKFCTSGTGDGPYEAKLLVKHYVDYRVGSPATTTPKMVWQVIFGEGYSKIFYSDLKGRSSGFSIKCANVPAFANQGN